MPPLKKNSLEPMGLNSSPSPLNLNVKLPSIRSKSYIPMEILVLTLTKFPISTMLFIRGKVLLLRMRLKSASLLGLVLVGWSLVPVSLGALAT